MKIVNYVAVLCLSLVFVGCKSPLSQGQKPVPVVNNYYYNTPPPAPVVAKPAPAPAKAKPAPAPAKTAVTAQKPAPPKVAPVPVLKSGRPDYSVLFINRTKEVVAIALNNGRLKFSLKPGEEKEVPAEASNNQIPYEAKIGNTAYADGTIKVDPGSVFYRITIRQ
ncbi:MAG: hypothetical protein WC250_02040 [Candidatus Paceibacterota bacterium]|jgi:hypothetical protein